MSDKFFSNRRHSMSGAFVFLLLGMFALLSTLMVLFSAKLYRSTVVEASAHSAHRVLNSYLLNTVHANDRAGGVSVRKEQGMDVLVFGWQDEADEYETLVYGYEGEIREMLRGIDEPFDPELGETICKAQRFAASLEDNLLILSITEGAGEEQQVYVALTCPAREEAAR